MQSTDTGAINTILSTYLETWRKHDMNAWGRLFMDDADFVTDSGSWWKSNQENVAGVSGRLKAFWKSLEVFGGEHEKVGFDRVPVGI